MRLKLLTFALLCICINPLFAEEKSPVKFGKVVPEDFQQKIYPIDSSAEAVVIADIGSTEVIGGTTGGFSLEFKRSTRVHILNKNGYDAATVEIPLYIDGPSDKESLESLKAITYILENGKVTEAKLDTKSGVFEDKINKNWILKKFTLPNIKEGCIIEYQYTIKSDFIFNLQPWSFQSNYPILWSEYNVTIPEFFYYVKMFQGYQKFYINTENTRQSTFIIRDATGIGASESLTFQSNLTDTRYVMKDVPALKEESFTTTTRNHTSHISFQLSERRYPLHPKSYMGTWPEMTNGMLEDEKFGQQLSKNNGWLTDIVSNLTKNSKSDLEKAYAIYTYIRDNITCTNHSSLYIETDLKTVLKNRNGNEAEINLLLTAMLLKANIAVDPVMLSTRQHGYVVDMYPILEKFNYIIARVKLQDRIIYLDASEPHLGFGKLNANCYNGMARVVNTDATMIDFPADSLKESSITSLMMFNDDNGKLTGELKHNAGNVESFTIRDKLKDKGKESIMNEIKKDIGNDAEIKDFDIDSLNKYDEPLAIHCNVDLKTDGQDIIYFNPMMSEAVKENPFKSAQRVYPIEMPYTVDENYIMRLEVPKGYTIDELPKSVRLKLDEEGDGMFEYLVSESQGVINLRSRITIKRAFFKPDEYEMLREFYNVVAKKHSEQIVFKKKS